MSQKPSATQNFRLKPKHLLLALFLIAVISVGALVFGVFHTMSNKHQIGSEQDSEASAVEIWSPNGQTVSSKSAQAAASAPAQAAVHTASGPTPYPSTAESAASAPQAASSVAIATTTPIIHHARPHRVRPAHPATISQQVQPINIDNSTNDSPAPEHRAAPDAAQDAPIRKAAPAPRPQPAAPAKREKDVTDNLF